MTVYDVYVKADTEGRIVAVNSSAFVQDPAGWNRIDSGEGDRYHHAQANYFEKSLTNQHGVLRYKLENGSVVERSAKEMEADWAKETNKPGEQPDGNNEERIAALEKAMRAIEEGVASV